MAFIAAVVRNIAHRTLIRIFSDLCLVSILAKPSLPFSPFGTDGVWPGSDSGIDSGSNSGIDSGIDSGSNSGIDSGSTVTDGVWPGSTLILTPSCKVRFRSRD